jgi:Outer membrane lipoprotein carrier protein LolA-like
VRARTRRALLRAAAIASAAAPMTGASAQGDPLTTLMRAFAAVPASRARFSEEKAIPELDLPLPSEGTLSWQAPDWLEKRTTSPIQEVLRVTGDRLVYERPDRGVRQEFALQDQPEMMALVTAIRGTLAGDLPALRRFYEVDFERGGGADRPWCMVLTPLSLRLRAAVQRIAIVGRGPQILELDTQAGGGTTRMRVAPAG